MYRAFQESLNRRVALKVLCRQLSREKKYVDRFLREARSAGTLNHPNVVQVHDAGQHDDLFYISMEYMAGGSLQAILDRDGPTPLARLLPWMCDAARALVWSERKGIIHRDIKPDNLLIDANGSLKIADFGISLNFQHSKTVYHDGKPIGTALFMAPEQALGKLVDHRADIYALGSTLYLSASGVCPHEGKNQYEIVHRKTTEPPRPLVEVAPGVPESLSLAVAKMLAREPEHRYQKADEVLRVLEEVAGKPATRPRVRRSMGRVERSRGVARMRLRRPTPAAPGATRKALLLRGVGLIALAAVAVVLAHAMGLTVPQSPTTARTTVQPPNATAPSPPAEPPSPGDPGASLLPPPSGETDPSLILITFKTLLDKGEYRKAEAELASYDKAAATANGQEAPQKDELEKQLLTRAADEVDNAWGRARERGEREGIERAASYLDSLENRLPKSIPSKHLEELRAVVSQLNEVRSKNDGYRQLEDEARIAIHGARFAEATKTLDGFLGEMASFRSENTIRAADIKEDATICKDVLDRLGGQLAILKTFELRDKAPATTQCLNCEEGTGKVTCSACGGSRMVEEWCSTCGGSREQKCKVCNGENEATCPHCDGKPVQEKLVIGDGRLRRIYVTCPKCNGKGKLVCPPIMQCEKCPETGKIKVPCGCCRSGKQDCALCSERSTVDVAELMPRPKTGTYKFQEIAGYELRVLDNAGEPRTLHLGDLDDELLLGLYNGVSSVKGAGSDPADSRENAGVLLVYAAGLGRAWSLLDAPGSNPAKSERRRARFVSDLQREAGTILEGVFRKLEDPKLTANEGELLSPLLRLFEAAALLPSDSDLRADLVAAYVECRRRELWNGAPGNLFRAAKADRQPDGRFQFVYDFKADDQRKDFRAGNLLVPQTTSPPEKRSASNTRRFLRGDPFRDDIEVEVELRSRGGLSPRFGVAFWTRENDRWTSDTFPLPVEGQAELPPVVILGSGLDISSLLTGVSPQSDPAARTSAVLLMHRNAERGFHLLGKPELLWEQPVTKGGRRVRMRISPKGLLVWSLGQNSLQQKDMQQYLRKPYRNGSVTFIDPSGNCSPWNVDLMFSAVTIRGNLDPFWVEDEVSRRAAEAVPSAGKSWSPAPGPDRLLEETRRKGLLYRKKMGTVFFNDEFQEKLDDHWRPARGNPPPFSLSARKGALALRHEKNALIGVGSNLEKALLTNCPTEWGDEFEVATRLIGAQSWRGGRWAGIVLVRGSKDAASGEYLAGVLSSEGGRLENALVWKEARSSKPKKLVSAKSEDAPAAWLRLRRRGDLYTFMTSTDGERFSVAAELLWDGGKPTSVGLVAEMSASEGGTETKALFDFFEVSRPPALGR